MVETNSLFMSQESKSRVKDFFSFDGINSKNALAGVGFISIMLMVGGVMAQAQSTPDATLDSNGLQLNTGTLDVNGNQIEDAGSILYDPVTGNLASSAIDFSAATASDVGLGNVRNIDLSTTGGSFLTYDTNNEEYNVDGASIQSGTTASDVGLGSVENEAAVAESGDTMTGELNIDNFDNGISFSTDSNQYINDPNEDLRVGGIDGISGNSINSGFSGGSALVIQNDDSAIDLEVEDTGSSTTYTCSVSPTDGSFNCDGSKNWVHDLGNGSEAVYSSQESPQVRAVYEGQTSVYNGATTVSLPSHFEKTVSDTEPMLRVQATPHELATVAVTERSDSKLVIEALKDVTVDYRVTGIREGYEDKQVVRPKEE